MAKFIPRALQKRFPGATVQGLKTTATHGQAAQPAEDQQIELTFQSLRLFISNHVEQFYDPSRLLQLYSSGRSDVMDIFDFEPDGPKGAKAGLRRYIASNVFKYVVGMTSDQSTTTPKYHRRMPTAFRDRFHRLLEPFTYNDNRSKWGLHLDEILTLGTELAHLVSSQPASHWRIGRFESAIIQQCDVRVFPSLIKNSMQIRREEIQIGCARPKEKPGKTSRVRSWGAKQTSRLCGRRDESAATYESVPEPSHRPFENRVIPSHA